MLENYKACKQNFFVQSFKEMEYAAYEHGNVFIMRLLQCVSAFLPATHRLFFTVKLHIFTE